MSHGPAGSTLYLMNNYWTRPTPVLRSLFLGDQAECRTCHAHVRPSIVTRAFVRKASASTASAWCTVCSTTTEYDLEPRCVA